MTLRHGPMHAISTVRQIRLPATLLSLFLLVVSPCANARDQYVGGAIDFNGDQNLWVTTLTGRYGREFVDSLTSSLELFGEVRASFGITEETTRLSSTKVDVGIENLIGVYASLRNPMAGSNLTPYLTLGFTSVAYKGSRQGKEARARDWDTSWGMGVDWKIDKDWMLNIDGMRYATNAGGDLFGVSIGASRWFK